MSLLFQPITIRSITIKNRIAVSPMCQYSAVDGYANDWHLVHLGSRAVGGAGLVISEATAVLPEGRITPGDLGIWHDEHMPGLRRITDFIHAHGAIAGIQLAHAGRKASCAVPWEGGKQLDMHHGGWQTVAPDVIPFNPDDRIPAALDQAGINQVIEAFRTAAKRAVSAGFKIAEIHSAHGYLLHEFLSPLSNQRTDQYGGSFENRIRLLLQVVEVVRKEWPDEYPVFVRLSATDWSSGGWTTEETVKLAAILKDSQVDLIDCSSGGNVANASIPLKPGYQVPFSAAVKKTGILTGAVGLITSAGQAENILQQGEADLILVGREMLRNPYFAFGAAHELNSKTDWPAQYLRAKPVD
ncbi:MAG: NADH:flavin oxidoreductase/NADH oxidase [Bacteroidales bacterium]|nr:NADH:flavin oxidoreductase/NADH oxidase [Bacteroidales bacterium]